MLCELCRIEGDPSEDADPTQWTVHEGVPITEDERERLVDAMDVLEEDSEQEARNLVLHRFQRLFAIKQESAARFEQLKSEPTGMKRLNSELRTALFEWLQAVRAFLDHTETRLKRRYGKDSDEVRRFKEATSQMFDAFFAYRFLYKLRNAQHVDFAPIGIVLTETLEDGHRVTKPSARFRRDELLAGFSEWGPVKLELEQFSEEFFMDEPVATMMQCLDYIAFIVAEIERPYLEEQVAILKEALSRLPAGHGFGAVVCWPEGHERQDQMQMRPLFDVHLELVGEAPSVIGRPAGRGEEWMTWEQDAS